LLGRKSAIRFCHMQHPPTKSSLSRIKFRIASRSARGTAVKNSGSPGKPVHLQCQRYQTYDLNKNNDHIIYHRTKIRHPINTSLSCRTMGAQSTHKMEGPPPAKTTSKLIQAIHVSQYRQSMIDTVLKRLHGK
jgi:hypothetical protein